MKVIRSLAVASAFLGGLAAPVLVQAQEPEIAVEESAAPAPEQLSDVDLDVLFERLSAADARQAGKISEEISRRWSRSGSDTLDLILKRGRDALQKGDADKAIAHFSRLIAFKPDFAEGWNGRATAHFANGEFGYALADLYHVIRLEPRHYGALSGLGIILEQLDMEAEAYAAYRQALALHPHLEGPEKGIERLEKSVEGQPI